METETRKRKRTENEKSGMKKNQKNDKGVRLKYGSIFMKSLLLAFLVSLLPVIGYLSSNLNPVVIKAPVPINLEGQKVNNALERGERVMIEQIGPDSIDVDNEKKVYTGLANGMIIKVHPSATGAIAEGLVEYIRNGPIPGVEPVDGHVEPRPLGVRLHGEHLYVIDAFYGLYSLHLKSKKVRPLVKPNSVQPSMKFPDDLDITDDGKYIYFTDSSSKWNLNLLSNDFIEGRCTGRLFRVNVDTLEITVIALDLCFPNGVQLSQNESVVAVTETSRYRVIFINVNTGEVQKSTVVPGMPDNIRSTKNGGYWVALPNARPGFTDLTSNFPLFRKILSGLLSPTFMRRFAPSSGGLAVELDKNGDIVGYLRDEFGKISKTVSEICETDEGVLLVGSFKESYIVKTRR